MIFRLYIQIYEDKIAAGNDSYLCTLKERHLSKLTDIVHK